jgi:hypothetical protein
MAAEGRTLFLIVNSAGNPALQMFMCRTVADLPAPLEPAFVHPHRDMSGLQGLVHDRAVPASGSKITPSASTNANQPAASTGAARRKRRAVTSVITGARLAAPHP